MKSLRRISVIGMGLLGGSISLAISRSLSSVKTVGYSHRAVTRRKARELGVAGQIVDDIAECVAEADIVIVATPISTFEEIFRQMRGSLKDGCIVTDVGSTKVLPHRWADKLLGKKVRYVGSHPIVGSEQRGVEFACDDLFCGCRCILTKKKNTNGAALRVLRELWSRLGCVVSLMSPAAHDRIFAHVSHLPHIVAAALVNASDPDELKYAGKGFIDTSRIASGPSNVWSDIVMANSANTSRGIDRTVRELLRLQKAVENKDSKRTEKLLEAARSKRAKLINYKIRKKELL